jgi:predicted PolB exonuclease-like 3'-5' exonuclease
MAYQKDNIDNSKQLAFDIETIPLSKDDLAPELEDLITRKLERAQKNNPGLDTIAERRKIMATDPLLGRIVCIGLYDPQTNTKLALTDPSEKEILKKFWKIISGFNGIFVGFNTVRFDIPFIVKRSMINRVEPTNKLFLQYTRFDPFPPHFDVMLILSGRDGFMSLKNACAAFGVTSPKEGAIRADGVEDAYKRGNIKEIAEYCLRDVVATHELFKIIIDYTVR